MAAKIKPFGPMTYFLEQIVYFSNLGKDSIKKTKKTMEFSKAGLTPASQATFGRSYGKKQKKQKRLKMIYVS